MGDSSSEDGGGALPKGKGLPIGEDNKHSEGPCYLLDLPPEMLDSILFLLSPVDLATVSLTCRDLRLIATADKFWRRIVQANVPGVTVTSPYPCTSFYDLYFAHELHWFLPKYKVWFTNHNLTGKLLVARYDPRTGNIEAYQLLAVSSLPRVYPWPLDNQVLVHQFKPAVKLHLDRPIVRLAADVLGQTPQEQHVGVPITRIFLRSTRTLSSGSESSTNRDDGLPRDRAASVSSQAGAVNRFRAEIPMIPAPDYYGDNDVVYSNFMLARRVEQGEALSSRLQALGIWSDVWPPPTVPAPHRVMVGSTFQSPSSQVEASDQAFRIHIGMRMLSRHTAGIGRGLGDFATHTYAHIGDDVITYATLDPKLYTPTARHPYRGIWVGDYNAHGCEFLLVHQPDDPEDDFDPDAITKRDDESDDEFARRKSDETVFRGRLEAIKLTGDPNIPRGAHTFIVEDLGENGFVREVHEEPFNGARMVKSKGHIAAAGFQDDRYMDSNLILISHNRLAHFWLEFRHVSFFERVDIDRFTGI